MLTQNGRGLPMAGWLMNDLKLMAPGFRQAGWWQLIFPADDCPSFFPFVPLQLEQDSTIYAT